MRFCESQKACTPTEESSANPGLDGALREYLEDIYSRLNRRELVHPDPLEFLYEYPDLGDRELVGLVAASLAYGRVTQILKSVKWVLGVLKPSPRRYLLTTTKGELREVLAGFRHRFTTGEDITELLWAVRDVILSFGSIGSFMDWVSRPEDPTVLPALCSFVSRLDMVSNGRASRVLSDPSKGGSCKRLNLYLRWMVRQDQVDPGGWEGLMPSKLIVPLDVHMHRVGLSLGFTSRGQPDLIAALEITRGFKRISPDDPVKYDFALTRPGIWGLEEDFLRNGGQKDVEEIQRPDRW